MKNKIIKLIFIYLFIMFLIYSGIFQDNTDPLKVSKYYLEYLKNGEWFLAYRIYKREFFDYNQAVNNLIYYYFQPIKDIKLKIIEMKINHAIVQAKIIYKNYGIIYSTITLEKEDKNWLITDVELKSEV